MTDGGVFFGKERELLVSDLVNLLTGDFLEDGEFVAETAKESVVFCLHLLTFRSHAKGFRENLWERNAIEKWRDTIKVGDAPVHRGIGGEAGLHGKNLVGAIGTRFPACVRRTRHIRG